MIVFVWTIGDVFRAILAACIFAAFAFVIVDGWLAERRRKKDDATTKEQGRHG